jgi:hypothetical protein
MVIHIYLLALRVGDSKDASDWERLIIDVLWSKSVILYPARLYLELIVCVQLIFCGQVVSFFARRSP